jgi:phage terminase large subunit
LEKAEKKEIILPHKFEPRWYQLEAMKAMDNGIKRVVLCFARGLGKDLTAMNFLIKKAMEVPGVYLHCFPNYNQAKRAIWKSVHTTHTGESIAYLDHIPQEIIRNKNSSEMMVTLVNGSIYCVMGLDGKNAMRARGMNPSFVILSEYAFMDPESWRTLEPRVKQNNGTAIFLSTPNGQNHFYELYNHACNDKKHYFSSLVTVFDAATLNEEDIEQLRREGVPEDFIQQEYFCSFKRGAEGSYYGKQIQKARDDERIGPLPIIPDLPVHTSWDIGIGDSTAIWMFQALRNGTYNFINYYENNGEGLEHYVRYLNDFKTKNNVEYGTHFVPHDMQNKEFTSGVDRLQTARDFGIDMTVVPRKGIDEGIQAVRSILPLCSFELRACAHGIKCLDFYRKKWNESLKVYYDEPLHDRWSHGCFVAGTRILTAYGEKNIEEIQIDDEIVTPLGLKKVKKKFNYEVDKILELQIGNTTLKTTCNHKIFTKRGLLSADELRYNDMVFTLEDKEICQKKFGYSTEGKNLGFRENFLSVMMGKLLYLTVTDSAKMAIIIEGENAETYIDMYGHIITVKFPKDFIYTIKTAILKTTIYQILTSYQPQNIPNCIILKKKESNLEKLLKLPLNMRKNGIEVQQEENGTLNIPKTYGKKESAFRRTVNYVINCLTLGWYGQNIAAMPASKKRDIEKRKPGKSDNVLCADTIMRHMTHLSQKHVVKNAQLNDKFTQKVYDFEVEDDHCYFANGILVSNSDSFRYAAVGIKSIGFKQSNSIENEMNAIKAYWG